MSNPQTARLRELVERWRVRAENCERYGAQEARYAALSRERANVWQIARSELTALLDTATPEPEMPEIHCPVCGQVVRQVSSASLDIALNQHYLWACPKRGEPSPPSTCGTLREVKLGVIEFHSPSMNPGLFQRFYEVVEDLRMSGSIVDLWLMDIASVLREHGYTLTITTNKPSPALHEPREEPR